MVCVSALRNDTIHTSQDVACTLSVMQEQALVLLLIRSESDKVDHESETCHRLRHRWHTATYQARSEWLFGGGDERGYDGLTNVSTIE